MEKRTEQQQLSVVLVENVRNGNSNNEIAKAQIWSKGTKQTCTHTLHTFGRHTLRNWQKNVASKYVF